MSDFDEERSLGYRTDTDVANYLEAIGDTEGADLLREAGVRPQGIGRLLGKAWSHTSHVVGFVEERRDHEPGPGRVPIRPAFEAQADPSLIGSQIKVTLDAFQVHEYPGLSPHKVLFDFQGRDQAGSEAQDLQFASVLNVNSHDRAAVSGVPIFTGLTVPGDGLSFKAKTIRIGSSSDQAIIDVLEGSAFKEGLKLMGTLQPALPQLVGLAAGITKNIFNRLLNAQIQCFDLGLDFGANQSSIRLRRGSYVVVQVPGRDMWRWEDWSLDRHTMGIVDSEGKPAPFNVTVFGITGSATVEARSAMRSEGQTALDTSRQA